ncbi:MAG TPA: terminase small subunit [Puia sp.]|jgi:phage terminase small subunit|nr:terminase small subunit [Puia sp.]
MTAPKSLKKAITRKPPKSPGKNAIAFTAKQELFCHEWLIDMNDTQAAIRSGYSKKTAGAIGHELLRNPKIRDRIDQLRNEALIRADLSLDSLINEMKRFTFWSIKDFVGAGNTILDLTTLPRELLKPVVGIKTTERYDPDGRPVKSVELKFVDKRASGVDLIRHLGGFEKDNQQKVLKISVKRK